MNKPSPDKTKTWLSWSSGKDSAFALYELQRSAEFEVTALLTTVNEDYDRVAMHAVRHELLERQARQAGLPLEIVKIPRVCTNEIYEAKFLEALRRAESQGVEAVAYGDLFLEDIRAYREKLHQATRLKTVFPLWLRPTAELAREMIRAGFKAIVTCVDPAKLSPDFAGRDFDLDFLAELPPGVDPCGENGEFHTFVYDGPIFRKPVRVAKGEVVAREGFAVQDLIPLV